MGFFKATWDLSEKAPPVLLVSKGFLMTAEALGMSLNSPIPDVSIS
jgi:hypothetical protein